MILRLQQLYNRLRFSSLFRSSGVYTLTSIINSAIPLLLLPVLTHKLSPADYGVVAMFQLAVSIIFPFIGMNLEGAIARKFYDKDQVHFPSYIGTCLLLSGVSFLIISLLFFLRIDYIHEVTSIPEPWLKFILITAVCQFITAVILVTFQVNVQPLKYGMLQISQSVLNVGLTILLVVVMHKTWQGRLEAQIISGVVFAVISLVILIYKRQIRFNVKKEDIVHALKFGVPLIPHAIGGIFFTTIDRFFLTKLVGLEQTGNYTVAYQLGAVVSLITVAFNNAYVPWLFENLNKDDFAIKKKIVKFTYLYFGVLILGACVLLLIFPLLVSIFVSKTYTSINTYSAFIVFGFVFQGMYFMVTNYITYSQKTYIQAILTFSVGLAKLPITYFSILWLGAFGASVSYCITFFIFFITTWILSAKVYKMPWNIFSY